MSTRFPSRVPLDEDKREALVDVLNTGLANTLDLYSQVKQAHWNVRGMFFYSRHLLFDELAEHLEVQADEIAERAGALGGYARGTVRMSAKKSELPAYDEEATDAKAHLRCLSERFNQQAQFLRKGIKISSECDPATEDLFTEALRQVELDLWFLESHLQD